MRSSIPVYVSIKGHDTVRGEVAIESVHKDLDSGFLKIQSMLMNTGPRHFKAIGTAAVFSENTNRLVDEQPTGQTLPVFAGFGERISVRFPTPPEGRYLATLTVDLGEDYIVQDQFAFAVTSTGRTKPLDD